MKTVGNWIKKIWGWIEKLTDTTSSVFLLAICLLIFTGVITRYILKFSLSWNDEVCKYLFCWMVFLGMQFGARDRKEIRIDILDTMLKGKAQIILDLVNNLLSILALAALLMSSIPLIQNGRRFTSPVLVLPMNLVYSCVFIGCVLIEIQYFIRLGKTLLKLFGRKEAES